MKKYFSLENLIILFLIILPIFDLIFFYNRVSTLIKIIFVFIIFIITLFKFKDKKALISFIIYFITLFVFFIFHNMNANDFKLNISYSMIEEIFYFIKMVTPLIFIYVVYKNILKSQNIKKAYKIIILFVSGSIVLLDLTCLSLSTYTEEVVSTSFIGWFFGAYDNYSYMTLAGRGLFYFPNHIIAILIMLIPIVFYIFIEKTNKLNILILTLLLLSLIILGNKTSVFGGFLVFIVLYLLYLFYTKIIKKYEFSKKTFIILTIILVIYPVFIYYSPAYSRVVTMEGTKTNYKSNGEEIDKIKYIEENYKEKKIPEQFIKDSYPYQNDPDFWIDIMNKPLENRINYRYLEISMMDRIIELNHNSLDKYLGISYSRMMNVFNVERDYTNQIYCVGIIGLILLIAPYILILIYLGIKVIKDKLFDIKNIILLFSISLILLIAYFMGNLFNSLSVMLPFAFVIGIALNNVIIKEKGSVL